jgi:hypothetical protein
VFPGLGIFIHLNKPKSGEILSNYVSMCIGTDTIESDDKHTVTAYFDAETIQTAKDRYGVDLIADMKNVMQSELDKMVNKNSDN